MEASGYGGFSFMPPLHGFEPEGRGIGQSARALCHGARKPRARAAQRPRAAQPAGDIPDGPPFRMEASGYGGFSFMPPLHGFEPEGRGMGQSARALCHGARKPRACAAQWSPGAQAARTRGEVKGPGKSLECGAEEMRRAIPAQPFRLILPRRYPYVILYSLRALWPPSCGPSA